MNCVVQLLIIFNFILPSATMVFTELNNDLFTLNITMNGYDTIKEDEYAFIKYTLPDEQLTIVGYIPLITMNSAHHMLTFACNQPGSDEAVWTGGSACDGPMSVVIHGWARDAPTLTLPQDVGFVVGKNTPYKYIVVNIHYLSILKNDYSGNQLVFTRTPRKYRAGIAVTGTDQIYLPPKTHTIHTPFSCAYHGPTVVIFATRVHAHQWARVNSLYRIRNGDTIEIVKGDPQWPQAFYPLASPIDIRSGDYLIGQCVYDNDDNEVIHSGIDRPTHNDEMCGIYAMYSYEPYDQKKKSNIIDPFPDCWNNGVTEPIIDLIPKDSEIRPIKSTTTNMTIHHRPALLFSEYHLVDPWLAMKTLNTPLGEITGIALHQDDNQLVVLHRGTRRWSSKLFFDDFRFRDDLFGPISEDVLIHINTRNGRIEFSWAANKLYLPHGLTIDHDGNYWLTDMALHQVIMFKSTDMTQPELIIGTQFEHGRGRHQFCQPTDVSVMKSGDFFVADGCNNRIVRFSRDGIYKTEWMSTEETGPFSQVHSIALCEYLHMLCVTVNHKDPLIKCFDAISGNHRHDISLVEEAGSDRIVNIAFVPNGETLFALTANTRKVMQIDVENPAILHSFSIINSELESTLHGIAVAMDGLQVYIADSNPLINSTLYKFESVPQTNFSESTLSQKSSFPHTTNFWILVSTGVFVFFTLIVIIRYMWLYIGRRPIPVQNYELVKQYSDSDDEINVPASVII